MRVVTARQPILNKKSQVVAYELLYRDGETNCFPDIDPHEATGKLMLNTHLNKGIHALTDGKKAFINFTEKCIKKRFPLMMCSEQIIVELIETINPEDDEIFKAVKELSAKGYKVALDDFTFNKAWVRYFPYINLIKVDISQTPLTSCVSFVNKIHTLNETRRPAKKLHLLAERVETQQEFEQARHMGFHYFQGYYFFKPELKAGCDVDLSSLALFQLYQELCKKELDIDRITEHFKNDAGLLYKLLTYINSGILPVRTHISNVKQALVYLGNEEVRKLLTLLTVTQMGSHKPKYLATEGAVRARCCEGVAEKVLPKKTEEAFLAGLISMLPALLDCQLEDLLCTLPLSQDVIDALRGLTTDRPSGILYYILTAVIFHSQAKWHDTVKACRKLNLEYDVLSDLYTRAISWTSKHQQTLGACEEA